MLTLFQKNTYIIRPFSIKMVNFAVKFRNREIIYGIS